MPNKATIKQARYDAQHTRRYGLKLNIKTDADIIQRLEQEKPYQGYIKKTIRADIAREGVKNE